MDTQLLESVKSRIFGIPADARRELIAKSRWTCDSHWMMAMVMNAGWDVANRMNFQVAETVGHVEMQRLMKAMNLERPRNKEDFRFLVTLAMEMFITKDYFDYGYEITDTHDEIAVIRQCYAYTKIHSIGVDRDYVCGCGALRTGWYRAMGVDVREKLQKCLKDGDERCEILVECTSFQTT